MSESESRSQPPAVPEHERLAQEAERLKDLASRIEQRATELLAKARSMREQATPGSQTTD